MLPDELVQEVSALIKRYPEPRSALLPSLYTVQRHLGHISIESMADVAELLGLPKAHVRGVATFHVMFRLKHTGRHLIQMCTNVSCMLDGSDHLRKVLKDRFGLSPGGTSSDKRFTFIEAECIGECEKAPAMIVDSDVHTHLNEEKLVQILEKYE